MELYIYRYSDGKHVATITGENVRDCEFAAARNGYPVDEFGQTTSSVDELRTDPFLNSRAKKLLAKKQKPENPFDYYFGE